MLALSYKWACQESSRVFASSLLFNPTDTIAPTYQLQLIKPQQIMAKRTRSYVDYSHQCKALYTQGYETSSRN